jgi:hypothetical protein
MNLVKFALIFGSLFCFLQSNAKGHVECRHRGLRFYYSDDGVIDYPDNVGTIEHHSIEITQAQRPAWEDLFEKVGSSKEQTPSGYQISKWANASGCKGWEDIFGSCDSKNRSSLLYCVGAGGGCLYYQDPRTTEKLSAQFKWDKSTQLVTMTLSIVDAKGNATHSMPMQMPAQYCQVSGTPNF